MQIPIEEMGHAGIAVYEFIKFMEGKGYDKYFQTNGAQPKKLLDSLTDYMEDFPAQFRKEVIISGYLEWNGKEEHNVYAFMWAKYSQREIHIEKMEINLENPEEKPVKRLVLENLNRSTFPSRKEAVDKVKGGKEIKTKKKKGTKI